MKVGAAVLTHNAVLNDRLELLEATMATLAAAGVPVLAVDNGSSDGTADIVRDWGGYCSTDRLTTCAHGTNLCARVALGLDVDVCVLSDDDMLWSPDWHASLVAWWSDAPDDIWLTGCHLEPEFPWNTVRGVVRHGDVPGLIRDSTGAASWTFRSADWSRIGPLPERKQGWGDVPACMRVRASGGRIAQIDLAQHAGHGQSTWGNQTVEQHGWDTTSVARMLEDA